MAAIDIVVILAAVGLSVWLTGNLRTYAIKRQLLDLPNERSSHASATPRGGGVAVAATAIIAVVVLASQGRLAWNVAIGLAGGGFVVAAVGFADDRSPLSPAWRLLAHFASAAWLILWLDRPAAAGLSHAAWLTAVGIGGISVLIVWVVNLTNFMDGIDGLASAECVFVCMAGALLQAAMPGGAGTWRAPLAIAAATLGFLWWNWPPAKIFLGDAGSGFLGLMVAGLTLQAASASATLLWAWLILFGVFIVDASVTLARRLFRGERIYQAHRTHAYQHAAARRGHRAVTLTLSLVNLAWLLPIAWAVGRNRIDGRVGLAVAYLPLVAMAWKFRAGLPAIRRPPNLQP